MTTQAIASPTGGRADAGPAAASPRAALPVLLAGPFMVVLDFFIGNVALPSIASDLHAGSGGLEWIAAAYGLAVGALLIAGGRLGDAHGRQRMYVAGVAAFTVASVACGLAPSASALIVARVAQGVGGALLMPQVLAIIGTAFDGADRARAMGIYSMTLGVGAAGGQLIGGALVQVDLLGLGWRSCFLINVPFGLAAIALAPRRVAESRSAAPRPLDAVGVALAGGAVTAVTLPLIEGRAHGWPLWAWLSFAAGPVLGAAFVAHVRASARRGGAPLVEPALFAQRAFSAGLVTQLLLWCGQAAFFVYLALYLQPGRGLNPLQAGVVFTFAAASYVVASGAAPELAARFGRRVTLAGGLTLAAGHGALALAVAENGVGGPVLALAPGLLLVGAGMGLCMTALNVVVLESLDEASAGAASGVLSTVQQIGNAIGVAVVGVVFFGALHAGYGHAFLLSALAFVEVGLAIAALTRLLPARARA